ncbi:MAG: hypothetical protein AB7T22_12280 [Calditrichaceae bacterium]
MVTNMTLSFMILLFAGGCISGGQDDNYIVSQVYSIDSVKIIKSSGLEYSAKIKAAVPNPCHEYSHIDLVREGNDIQVLVYSKIRKDVTCIQVLGSIEAEISFKVESAGDYRIHFKGRSRVLDVEAEIKD